MLKVDPATICPSCMKPDALRNGTCRFCKKSIPTEVPVGVLSPGTILKGQYLTGLTLGQGGFGITYRAYDLVNYRAVAIKEYYPGENGWCSRSPGKPSVIIQETAEFDYGLRHFRGEAEILRILSEIPEIVQCYEIFDENHTAYYVMELLDGQTLQGYLKDKGKPLGFDQTVELLMPVMLGLEKIHQHNATHRDIKPSNIFICKNGFPKILDFGAAAADSSQYAESFMPIMSEGYSPPEQNTLSHEKGKQGPWSDVYALAGTIYRCVTGRRPPSASGRQAGDELQFKSGEFTASQRKVMERNLSLHPEERCQTMLLFAEELVGCMHEQGAQQLRKRYTELKRKVSSLPVKTVTPKPREHSNHRALRQSAAFCTDMTLFQALPGVIAVKAGLEIPLLLIAGYMAGTLISWLMTDSNARGSPGEMVFGLQVATTTGKKPGRWESLLYCMLRMLWPIKPADLVSYASDRIMLNQKFSGCASMLKKRAPALEPQKLIMQVTEGLYAGNHIPIPSGTYVFGRYPDICNLVFPMVYTAVSRVQCVLVVDALNNVFVTNRSSQGTTVDGRKLQGEESVRAKVGSEIAFGKEKMVITCE